MNKSPIGITFPLTHGTQGYFQQSFDTVSQACANIQNLFYTRIGERPMNPAFGSKIYQFVFEPNEIDERLIENLMMEEVLFWIPGVMISSVQVSTPSNSDDISDYSIVIQVTFVVNGIQSIVQLVFDP
jgi:phage baseplate assembly protein W